MCQLDMSAIGALSNIQLALTKAIQVSRSSFLPRNKKVSGFKHILYSSLEKIKKKKMSSSL